MSDVPALIPSEVIGKWRDLLGKDKAAADELYFTDVLPALLPQLEERPQHRALRDQRHHTLVSLMGFSPETTIISTAILRPQRLLVVLSERGEASYDRAHDFLTGHKLLRPSQIQKLVVSPTDPMEIYREIKRALARGAGSGGEQAGSHIFDVTGGKKIMSATLGQVAWEEDWPLCYVESRAYDEVIRRPVPGHEELIRLPNPSQVRVEQARRAALDVYAARNYAAAFDAFTKSKHLRVENRLDSVAVELCSCYMAWTDSDLPRLGQAVERLSAEMNQPRIADLLAQAPATDARRAAHVRALQAVAASQPPALIATYLELAVLYRSMRRHDFACLLAYRAMEALVEHGLRALAGPGFDRDAPNYDLFGDRAALERGYVELSRRLGGGHVDADLPRRIGFINGLGLLCVLANVHERSGRPLDALSFLRMMRAEAERRNGSVLAHGSRTLTENDSGSILERAEMLATAILDANGSAQLRTLRDDLAPLVLDALARASA